MSDALSKASKMQKPLVESWREISDGSMWEMGHSLGVRRDPAGEAPWRGNAWASGFGDASLDGAQFRKIGGFCVIII